MVLPTFTGEHIDILLLFFEFLKKKIFLPPLSLSPIAEIGRYMNVNVYAPFDVKIGQQRIKRYVLNINSRLAYNIYQ